MIADTSVAVVGGPRLFREAFARAVDAAAGLTVVATTGTGTGLAVCERLCPEVVVVDATDGARAIDLCASVKVSNPQTKVLVLSDEGAPEFVVHAVEAGADGLAMRSSRLDELVDALRAVALGNAHVPAELLGPLLRRLIDRRREEDAVVERLRQLTARELEVLALLFDGLNREELAAALYISVQTARTHVKRVMAKLGVHSQRELVALVASSQEAGRLLAKAVPA